MKIKNRLFVSNILMLVIPVAASAFVAYAILFMFSQKSENPMERAFPRMFGIAGDFRRTNDTDRLLASAKAFNGEFGSRDVFMVIARDGGFIYPESAETLFSDCEELLPIAMSEGFVGNMSLNDYRVVADQIGEYRVLLAYLRGGVSPGRLLAPSSHGNLVLVFGILILIIILTNRLLTHLLTRSIIGPLNSLAEGVHELRDGNLEYRIPYKRRDEFAPVCDDFNEMAGQLQSLIERQRRDDESRRELLAGISHDLRTPLTSIKAYVEGLLDGVADDHETQMKYLGVVRQKSMDIDSIVDKLFLFSKLEIGEFPFYSEKLNIGWEVAEIVSSAADEYGGKGLDICLKSNLSGFYVFADTVQLRNAFANIMENSLIYRTKPKGLLTVDCRPYDDRAEIIFTDDGPGIPEESIPKLFDVFFRGDESRSNPGKGSGLGLAITARIIRRMEGSIRAENVAEGGLRIIMTLPKYAEEESG